MNEGANRETNEYEIMVGRVYGDNDVSNQQDATNSGDKVEMD